VAQEIVASRDWILPHFHGMPYLDKPILYFAAVASSLAMFGSTEAAARLPSLLFAIATGLATWALARRLFSARAAWASVIALASSPLFLVFARTVIFDIALTCFVTFAIFFAVEARAGRRWGFPLFWVCTALAVLTKGPVGLLLPLLGFLALTIGLGKPRRLRGLFHPLGIATFLAVCMPWVLAVESRQPGFLRYALLVETVERLTRPTFQRTGPPYYYVPILLMGLLPWSIVAVGRLPAYIRSRRDAFRPSAERGLLFAVLAIVAFFSASSSKLGGYVLPVVPLIAVLIGREVVRFCWMGGRLQAGNRAAPCADPLSSADLRDAAPFADPRSSADLRGKTPFADLQPSAQSPPGATRAWTLVPGIVLGVLGALLITAARAGLPLDRWLRQPAVLAGAAGDLLTGIGIVFTVCGLGLLVLNRMRRPAWAPIVLGLVAPMAFVVAIAPMVRYADQNSSRQLAAELRRLGAETRTVATVRCFPTSLDFYLGRVVPVVTETGREITSTYVARNHDALKAAGATGLWSPQDLDAALLAGTVGILITRSDTPPGPEFHLASRVRKYRIWAREGLPPPPR
jgi:4-amino-4-deoxy-L-arabinose transferase-like glycosyltransferase